MEHFIYLYQTSFNQLIGCNFHKIILIFLINYFIINKFDLFVYFFKNYLKFGKPTLILGLVLR